MADLTTYEFYTDTYYGDTVSETDFPKWLSKATDMLDFLTYGNINDVSIVGFEVKVQKAVCALMDEMFKVEQAKDNTVTGEYAGNVKSRSSGGESITYNDVQTVYTKAISDEKAKQTLFYDTVREYLTGTGLLYAGY
jgi:hypothetical protein